MWWLIGICVAVAFWMQRRPRARLLAVDDPPDSNGVGQIAIEDSIDLHGYAPRDIPDVAEAYLEAALEAGFEEVRLIHGRGKGVQRARIRSLLAHHPHVAHFDDAPAHRGGWGAQVVTLERSPSRQDLTQRS